VYDSFIYNGTLTNYASKTDWFWITHNDNNYSNFNFDYHVPRWEQSYVQVFGDQHAQDSKTYLVNKKHDNNTSWQFHQNKVQRIASVPIFHATNLQPKEEKGIRMFSNFFNFIKRCCNKTESEYFWITSSVCDYSQFDFTWHPDIGEENFLHAWTSPNNQYGYTFFVPRKIVKSQISNIQKLEWFDKIKYHYEVPVHALPINTFTHKQGVAKSIKEHNFTHHYEWFLQKDVQMDVTKYEPARWDAINLETFGENNNAMLVPREAKSYIDEQVYDYPNIVKHKTKLKQPGFDTIVLGYKEPNIQENYNTIKKIIPNAKLVTGIDGNVNAYKHCAVQSETDYFWCVFAKSNLHPSFTFDFHPDCLERPHHYIFKCYNPLIDYAYGHMGIILYHKQTVIDAKEWGPDFTCSFPVKLVDQVSNIANYFHTPFLTYRTAFRECVKLASNCIKGSDHNTNNIILNKWLNSKDVWTTRGAKDAIQHVDKNKDLMQVFDWKFIESIYSAWV
tara:strand:+ start:3412 stop:4920 length:1509 start_codon:yes stop_codon:yes gene_type:complete